MTALKYNIRIQPQRWRRLITPPVIVVVVVLALPFVMHTYLWDWIEPQIYSVLLSALLLLALIIGWRQGNADAIVGQLSDTGAWSEISQSGQTYTWQMSAASRVTGFAVYVHMYHEESTRCLWVLRSEVSEQNFRRLCRIAVNLQTSY